MIVLTNDFIRLFFRRKAMEIELGIYQIGS